MRLRPIVGPISVDEPRFVNVSICGHDTATGQAIATLHVDQTGLILFRDHEGRTASCKIDDSLQIGKECTAGRENTDRPTSTMLPSGHTTTAYSTVTSAPRPGHPTGLQPQTDC